VFLRSAVARAWSTAAPVATAAVIAAAAGAAASVATARVPGLVRWTAVATGLLPTVAIVVRHQLQIIRRRRGIVASDRPVTRERPTHRLVSQTTRRVRVRCSSVHCGPVMAGAV
jgi:hypothetical protein